MHVMYKSKERKPCSAIELPCASYLHPWKLAGGSSSWVKGYHSLLQKGDLRSSANLQCIFVEL